jgi:hypothetical protein
MVSPTPTEAVLTPYAPCAGLGRPGSLAPCRFGTERRKAVAEIALTGDSHAGHWRAAVRIVAQARRWRGTSITRTGCQFTAAPLALPTTAKRACARWNADVLAWFHRHPEIETVFVSDNAQAPVVVRPGESAFAVRRAGYVSAWRALSTSVKRVLVLRDVPRRRLRTLDCVEHAMGARRPAGTACAVPRRRALHLDPAVSAAHRLHTSRVRVVDLTRYFCSRRLCFPVVGGVLVHKDTNHLTTAFAESLAPYLLRRVNALVPIRRGTASRPAAQSPSAPKTSRRRIFHSATASASGPSISS